MHELGVTKSIAEAVLNHATAVKAEKVVAVNLLVGNMRNLEQEWVQRYFRRCAKGTIAAEAEVKITYVPIAFFCHECGETFTVDLHKNQRFFCPSCGSDKYEMATGRELKITSIEFE